MIPLAGGSSILHGERGGIQAKFIAAMGAPKTNLLEALASGLGSEWKMYVVDLGISDVTWRKYDGTKKRFGGEFGNGWVVELAYQGGLE